jgi:nitrogen regulatory protein PII
MPEPFETAKVKLVTIVASHGLGDHIASDLRALGVGGVTKTKADGWGSHGPRQFGLVDGANIRLDMLVSAELAQQILEHVVEKFSDEAVVAFMQTVEAVPRSRFV